MKNYLYQLMVTDLVTQDNIMYDFYEVKYYHEKFIDSSSL